MQTAVTWRTPSGCQNALITVAVSVLSYWLLSHSLESYYKILLHANEYRQHIFKLWSITAKWTLRKPLFNLRCGSTMLVRYLYALLWSSLRETLLHWIFKNLFFPFKASFSKYFIIFVLLELYKEASYCLHSWLSAFFPSIEKICQHCCR